MRLELRHLAPYLTHKLKAKNCFNEIVEVKGIQFGNESCNNVLWTFVKNGDYLQGYMYQCKPILRPLSDLTNRINPIQHETHLDRLIFSKIENVEKAICNETLFLCDYNYLIEHHFDVFGLIEKNLAIDINTI